MQLLPFKGGHPVGYFCVDEIHGARHPLCFVFYDDVRFGQESLLTVHRGFENIAFPDSRQSNTPRWLLLAHGTLRLIPQLQEALHVQFLLSKLGLQGTRLSLPIVASGIIGRLAQESLKRILTVLVRCLFIHFKKEVTRTLAQIAIGVLPMFVDSVLGRVVLIYVSCQNAVVTY